MTISQIDVTLATNLQTTLMKLEKLYEHKISVKGHNEQSLIKMYGVISLGLFKFSAGFLFFNI